jgi:hypothetical protein
MMSLYLFRFFRTFFNCQLFRQPGRFYGKLEVTEMDRILALSFT